MVFNIDKIVYFFRLLKQSIKGEQHDYTQGSVKSATVYLPFL